MPQYHRNAQNVITQFNFGRDGNFLLSNSGTILGAAWQHAGLPGISADFDSNWNRLMGGSLRKEAKDGT